MIWFRVIEVEKKFVLVSRILLYLLPIAGVAGIIFPLIFGQTNLSLLGTYLAIPMIFAPIIYLKQREHEIDFSTHNQKLFTAFIGLYFICILISIYLLYSYDIRPVTYYLIISITCCLILLEILLFEIKEKEVTIILLQLMILTVDIIWGVTLKYNFFIARTDPIAHAWYIQILIDNAHVSSIFGNYVSFPLWHILCTFVYEILGIQLSTRKIMFFTNGLIYSFIPIITYLISIKILNDKKICLLSALFVSVFPDTILYGMSSIPRSVVSFLEILLILVLLYRNNNEKKIISIILLSSIIIYHTVSMPFIILIFLAAYIIQKICDSEQKRIFVSLSFLILAMFMTLLYWTFFANYLLQTIIDEIVAPAPAGILTKSILSTPLNELFNYLEYSPLLFFVITGFFTSLKSEKVSILGKVFCILGFLSVSVTFPGPSLLLNKLAENFDFNRFGEYTFLFIGLTASVGFYNNYMKSKKYGKLFYILLFMIMIFLSVSNDFNASDNPLVKRPFYTFYITEVEETSFNHIASVTQGYIMSDYVTNRYLSNTDYASKSNILELSKKMKFLRNQTDDVFLIRRSELSKRPFQLYQADNGEFVLDPDLTLLNYFYQDNILWNDLLEYNKIYDSGSVEGYN
jgi:hypothetical protein